MKKASAWLFFCLLATGVPARAATVAPAISGNWNSPATWTGGALPGAADTAYIRGEAVTLDQVEPTVKQLQVNGGGALDVRPGGYVSATSFLAIGTDADVAILNMTGGQLDSPAGVVIGYALNGTVHATISGGTISATLASPQVYNGITFGPATQVGSASTTVFQSGGLLTTNASIQLGGQGSAKNTGATYIVSGGTVNWEKAFNVFPGNTLSVVGSNANIVYSGSVNTGSDVFDIQGSLNMTLDANGVAAIQCANSRVGLGSSSVLTIDGSAYTGNTSTQIPLLTFSALDASGTHRSTFSAVNLVGFGKWLTPTIVYNPDSIVLSLVAAPVFSVRDYGALPNQTTDAGPAIRAAIAAAVATRAPAQIVFENGTYPIGSVTGVDVWWPRAALVIANAENLLIRGTGATTLTVTDPTSAGIVFNTCQNVAVMNLTIDYDPAPFVQSTITAIDPLHDTFDVQIDPGNPGLVDYGNPAFSAQSLGNEYTLGADGRPIYNPYQLPTNVGSSLGGGAWRLTTPSGGVALSGIAVGNRFYSRMSTLSAALSFLYCTNAWADHVTVCASPCFAFYPTRSSKVTLSNCLVISNPIRNFSSNRDGIHAVGNRNGLTIRDCFFAGMGDDAINLSSAAILPVSSSPDGKTFVFKPSMYTIVVGDQLEAIHPETGEIIGKNTVTSVATTPNGYWQVTFNNAFSPISLSTDQTNATGDQFYNLSEANNGFCVQDTVFDRFFGRGILVSACQGSIRGCVFDNTAGHFLPSSSDPNQMWGLYWGFNLSLLFSFNPSWGEGPIAESVTVLDNTFNGNGSAPSPRIWMANVRRGGGTATVPGQDAIDIKKNTFLDLVSQAANLSCASNLKLQNNLVEASGASKPAPNTPVAFILTGCPAAVTSGNESTDPAFSTILQVNP